MIDVIGGLTLDPILFQSLKEAFMTTKPKDEAKTSIAKPYEQTPREKEAVEKFHEHSRTKGAPDVKVTKTEALTSIGIDHADPSTGGIVLMQALGSNDPQFFYGILEQLGEVSNSGQGVDEKAMNFMLAVIRGIEPRDQVESMLAAQMAAIHKLTMKYARQLARVENIPQQDSAERTLNKLARTFASQVEALKRYRSGGEQKVTVQHVSVSDGGQAIVGTVNTGGGVRKKPEPTS